MKSMLIIMLLIFTSSVLLYGVEASVKKRFEKVQVIKAKDVEIVKMEIIKPDIERYQKKTDTVLYPGHIRFNKKIVRATNRVLLNKWLKEIK